MIKNLKKEKQVKKAKISNKGITLIALVITIIVLLILSGVGIATLTGENGLLTRAEDAKISDEEAKAEDEFALISNEWAIEKHTGKKTLREFLVEKKDKGKISELVDNENGTYTMKLKGYQTTINQEGKISELFNPVEWDKNAVSEDYFIWESDIEGEEGYNTIIGYTAQIEKCTLLRYPSRCKKISFSRYLNYNGITTDASRSFTNNILKIEIPSTVTEIKDGAYGFDTNTFAKLKEVAIEYGLNKIERFAFYGCSNLEKIKIPDSVICVEENALEGTKWYEQQTKGLVYIGRVAYKYFGEMDSGTEIVLLNGTTEIADGAFKDCSNLINIVIPDSVTHIRSKAFEGCNNIKTIKLPKSLKRINYGAFFNCSELCNIIIPSDVEEIEHLAFLGCKKLNSITIPDKVKEIKSQTFEGCDNLASIKLPKGITTIGYRAFVNCSNLKDIYYKGTEEEWNNIIIEPENSNLTEVTIHYNQ